MKTPNKEVSTANEMSQRVIKLLSGRKGFAGWWAGISPEIQKEILDEIEMIFAEKSSQHLNSLICPVCGGPGKLQFTKMKGKPYISCDAHKVMAISLNTYGDPRIKGD